jgi:hypothetical protein
MPAREDLPAHGARVAEFRGRAGAPGGYLRAGLHFFAFSFFAPGDSMPSAARPFFGSFTAGMPRPRPFFAVAFASASFAAAAFASSAIAFFTFAGSTL